jgi:hypothetical protein
MGGSVTATATLFGPVNNGVTTREHQACGVQQARTERVRENVCRERAHCSHADGCRVAHHHPASCPRGPAPRRWGFLEGATSYGGAIFAGPGSRAKISGCTFNAAGAMQGGAIAALSSGALGESFSGVAATVLEVTDSNFVGCYSNARDGLLADTGAGGAIFIKGGRFIRDLVYRPGVVKASISNSVFTGSYVTRVSITTGGAIMVGGLEDDVTISDCTFQANRASFGAAVYVGEGSVAVARSTFAGNIGPQGSALGAFCAARVSLMDCKFTGLVQARATIYLSCEGNVFPGTMGGPSTAAIDGCDFSATSVSGDNPADYIGTKFVITDGKAMSLNVTRSAFRNAPLFTAAASSCYFTALSATASSNVTG